jgi:Polysaccharide pyruvyl transferase
MSMPVILYGALPWEPQTQSTMDRIARQARIAISSMQALSALKNNHPPTLNYRNFDSRNPSNVGDFSICLTIEQIMRTHMGRSSFDHVLWGRLDSLAAKQDRVINFTGGGYLFFSPDGQLSPRVGEDVIFAERHHCTFNMIGIGINQPQGTDSKLDISKDAQTTIRKLIQHCQSVSVRDELTRKVLQDITGRDFAMLGDPALHLASVLGIQRSSPPRQAGPMRIGINFAFHGPTSNQIFNRNIARYVSTLKILQKRLDARFVYMQHHAAESAIPGILRSSGIALEKCKPRLGNLLPTYAGLDFHIGAMLHSCILALSVDTPCLALAYDIKHRGLFDLFEMPENCLSGSAFDPDALLEAVDREVGQATARSASIAKRRRELEGTFLKHMNNIRPD